nr:hypothetical protein [Tanacetum cinerariifolium]
MDAERIIALRKRTRKEKVEKDQTIKKQKGDELEQDNTEKQKLEEQHEAEEIKKNLEVVPDDKDDVFVNVTPLSSKPPTIMDYKIYIEGKKGHFQISRANVPLVTPAPTATTTTITEAQLQALIDRGVAAAMAEAEASGVRNGYDNNGLGPRLAQAIRECTYLDF